MDNLTKIGYGEYGIVYKTKFNNNDVAIKQFKYSSDFNNEIYIYTKLLSIPCGKIQINKLLFININCVYVDTFNNNITLNGYNLIYNIMTINDKKLLTKIQSILNIDYGNINYIYYDIGYDISAITAKFDKIEYNIGHVIKNNNCYNIYIDSFEIIRLLNYDNRKRLLYFEYLGQNTSITKLDISL